MPGVQDLELVIVNKCESPRIFCVRVHKIRRRQLTVQFVERQRYFIRQYYHIQLENLSYIRTHSLKAHTHMVTVPIYSALVTGE